MLVEPIFRGGIGAANDKSRLVCNFSCGASSAVAAKMALAFRDRFAETVVVYADTGNEHPDNMRFLREIEEWIEHPVTIVKNEKYEDLWDMWEQMGFIAAVKGKNKYYPCTGTMKKQPLQPYEVPTTDVKVIGYTIDERTRIERIIKQSDGTTFWFPCVDAGLDKGDVLAVLERLGIALPVMYSQGYDHNNCVGCVKAGKGYWNRIRVDYPEAFARMADLERRHNTTIFSTDAGEPLFLDELSPTAGNFKEDQYNCSIMCQMVVNKLEAKQ